jgi:proton-dependent oligopeptide transporter, POT family
MRYAGLKKSEVRYDPATRTLTTFVPLKEKEIKGLLVAGGEPGFREVINGLYQESHKFRVSSWWLVWSYILATLGELCLSPVGLSMVSKLAPAKFATMLMGVWMLTSAFGNFAAGVLGEVWGTVAPVPFFLYTTLVVAAAALVLLLLVRLLTRMMHGVN